MDMAKFKQAITHSGKRYKEVALAMGMDYTTLYRKMQSSGGGFTIEEVEGFRKCVGISGEEMNSIFFAE